MPPNKTKFLAIDLSDFTIEDDNNMLEMDELLQSTKYDSLKTTCKGALPNFKNGKGDNLWSYAIYLLECILGRNPVTDYGFEPEDVASCIHQKDFYGDFKKSKIYLDHYENDEEFPPIDEFLKIGLVKDPESRQKHFNLKEFGDENNGHFVLFSTFDKYKVDKNELKLELAKYCDAFLEANSPRKKRFGIFRKCLCLTSLSDTNKLID